VSAGYSPPEQYWGAADPRSDIYALGATMHFLLTGEEPLALQVSSPKSVDADLSEHADMIVQRATAQDLLLRYQSAVEMKEDIDKWKEVKKGSKSKATSVVLISLLSFFFVVILATAYSILSSMNKQDAEKQAARYQEQINHFESRERNLLRENAQKDQELKKLAQTQQAPPVDVVKVPAQTVSQPAPAQTSLKPVKTHLKPATVAFREVDEAQLTDPEGLAPPEDDVQQPSLLPPFMRGAGGSN
jgi:serine/threonine protein kinase